MAYSIKRDKSRDKSQRAYIFQWELSHLEPVTRAAGQKAAGIIFRVFGDIKKNLILKNEFNEPIKKRLLLKTEFCNPIKKDPAELTPFINSAGALGKTESKN